MKNVVCGSALLFAGVALSFAIAADGPIRFIDIAASGGIRFTTENCPTPQKHQPETMPGGVALFDFDGDGLLDIYFVNGAEMPSLQKTGPKYSNKLFHNDGNGSFTDVTEHAGVAGSGYGMGVAVGDYDNDSWPDLYVANVNGNQLFHNNGNGTFTDVTGKAGVAGGIFDGRKMWSISAGWIDYNNDGLLDLFVSNYCQWDPGHEPDCTGIGGRGYCHPKNFGPLPNTIYRNNGDGTFTDVTQETGIAAVRGKGMGVAFADYDGDGFTDIFLANDNSPNVLFHNVAGKRFEDAALTAGVAYNEDGDALAGMGAEFRDVNNDGLPDIWHTAIENETFPLFLNRGAGQFQNATQRSHLAKLTRTMSGWSNAVVDLDNDGWKDLVVARGNVMDNIEEVSRHFHYSEPNSLLRNLANGQFEDVSAMAGTDFVHPAPNRGLAYGDFDNDGRVDLVMTALGSRARVLHNETQNRNHWLALKLKGVSSNRMGLGARVRITTGAGLSQYAEATTSTGYAASSDPRIHFGLGAATVVKEIEIRWPSGIRQVLHSVTGDRIVDVTETAPVEAGSAK